MSIDLAQPRVLAFEVAGQKFTLTCRPITEKMWLQYFAAIVSTARLNEEGDEERSFDASGARLALLESALTDATGYTEGPISAVENWQQQLPIAHRRAAADLLLAVEADASAPTSFSLGHAVAVHARRGLTWRS